MVVSLGLLLLAAPAQAGRWGGGISFSLGTPFYGPALPWRHSVYVPAYGVPYGPPVCYPAYPYPQAYAAPPVYYGPPAYVIRPAYVVQPAPTYYRVAPVVPVVPRFGATVYFRW